MSKLYIIGYIVSHPVHHVPYMKYLPDTLRSADTRGLKLLFKMAGSVSTVRSMVMELFQGSNGTTLAFTIGVVLITITTGQ